jgi:hypothetical protein
MMPDVSARARSARCGRREFWPNVWYAHKTGAERPRLFLGEDETGSGRMVVWTREPATGGRRFACSRRAWADWAGRPCDPPAGTKMPLPLPAEPDT